MYADDLPSSPRIREFRKSDPLRPVLDIEFQPAHQIHQLEVFGVHRVPSLLLGNAHP